jgi:hypothetical protein
MESIIQDCVTKTENPHLSLVPKEKLEQFMFNIIRCYKSTYKVESLKILDIGGGKGWSKLITTFPGCVYHILDLHCTLKHPNITFIQGDITSSELNLPTTYDIIFTKDTFEHILNPWDSTLNIINGLNEHGLFIFLAPFSWRYHASPFDTFRYTHTGAQYMFERMGKLKKVYAGYISCGDVGGFWKNNKDKTIDKKAFPKCLETIYIGQKDSGHSYSKDHLDADYSWDHSQ